MVKIMQNNVTIKDEKELKLHILDCIDPPNYWIIVFNPSEITQAIDFLQTTGEYYKDRELKDGEYFVAMNPYMLSFVIIKKEILNKDQLMEIMKLYVERMKDETKGDEGNVLALSHTGMRQFEMWLFGTQENN